MKKILKSMLLVCFLIFLSIFTIKVYPVVRSGYDMYRNSKKTVNLDKTIAEVQSRDNYVKLDEVSEEFIKDLIKSEDKRFYSHSGFDLIATTRAMFNNIKLGYFAQGGSTITQQLAKNIYFSFEKRLERKVAELFAARDIERHLTKDQILELYINIIYFGEGCYGIKEASYHYYGVSPSDLTSEQVAALVWTIKSPNNYNPNILSAMSANGI
ncbi:biosynthetic peptidoglycan transglycosylase [Anaerocolumna sp.]|uniref:biosynthetic peptidoglycan transglycosylase n=1 Tax=Anaerocolumna sp. TaxID=2041569 RepID=UPI0028A6558E|nr:biosynthetic peptidoglycan transglycosylase [Anaerocolumna sp.]